MEVDGIGFSVKMPKSCLGLHLGEASNETHPPNQVRKLEQQPTSE
jgi:hypothetical protein